MTDDRRDTVLVVDDSPETLGFVTEALKKTGVAVLVATSGETALNICNKVTPDTILMDAVMPGLDGFETCRQIKENPALQHVPVIFMTGLSETEHVVKALESGGVDFLTKPIDVDELKARIKVHLKNARSVQSAHVALDAAGRHLVAVSQEGTVLWSTPQIHNLLAKTGAAETSLFRLGRALGDWLDGPNSSASVARVSCSAYLKTWQCNFTRLAVSALMKTCSASLQKTRPGRSRRCRAALN